MKFVGVGVGVGVGVDLLSQTKAICKDPSFFCMEM